MVRSHLTLRQLEIFLVAIEQKSFRRAGEALNLAPVVVGEHIRMLEDRLSGALFLRRSGSAPVLTDLGERVLQRARDVMAAVDRLVDETTHQRLRSEWRFGFMPFMLRHLAGRVTELRRCYPECHIVTKIGDRSSDSFIDMVFRGEVDLAMTIVSERDLEFLPATIESRVVIEEPLSLLVAHDHPLARQPGLSVSDLAPYPAVQLTRGHPLRDVVDAALEDAGLGQPACSLETDDYNEILRHISQTDSFACLFSETAPSEAMTHHLQVLDLNFHLPAAQAIMMLTPAARTDSRLLAAADFLANHYRFDAVAARQGSHPVAGRHDPGK